MGTKTWNRETAAKFGKEIRETRKGQGLTQCALAKALGIHQSNISLVENGKGPRNLTLLVRFGLGLEYIEEEINQEIEEEK